MDHLTDSLYSVAAFLSAVAAVLGRALRIADIFKKASILHFAMAAVAAFFKKALVSQFVAQNL